jgi:hypothetical protein
MYRFQSSRNADAPPIRRARPAVALALTAWLVVLAVALLVTAATSHAATAPKAVALSDASVAPTTLRVVKGYGEVAVPKCKHGRTVTDVSAYTGTGRALSAQGIDPAMGYYWQAPSGRRVGYDGRSFYNGLSVPVIVAVWCG